MEEQQKTTKTVSQNIRDILKLNEGKQCSFVYKNRIFEAQIIKCLGDQVVLQSNDSQQLFKTSYISQLKITNMIYEQEQVIKTQKRKMTFRFKSKTKGQKKLMRFMYFGPGLRWTPTYKTQLDKVSMKAKIRLQAEIQNDKEESPVANNENYYYKNLVSF